MKKHINNTTKRNMQYAENESLKDLYLFISFSERIKSSTNRGYGHNGAGYSFQYFSQVYGAVPVLDEGESTQFLDEGESTQWL